MPVIPLYGVFPIYKPAGITTISVLNKLQHNLGVDKILHSGALSRHHEGVMVMGVGKTQKYTKEIQAGGERKYLIRGVLGVATSTFCSNGDYIKVSPYHHVTKQSMQSVLDEQFTGTIHQIPPLLPSFKFMKEKQPQLPVIPSDVKDTIIKRVEVIDFDKPSFQLHVYTKGRLYANTLTHDLGCVLDSAAHLTHLCRVKQSDFGFKEVLHHNEWDADSIYNNLYLPSTEQ